MALERTLIDIANTRWKNSEPGIYEIRLKLWKEFHELVNEDFL